MENLALRRTVTNPSKTILFGVSGGDCPGLNAILAGLVKGASRNSLQVATLQGGFQTLCAKPERFAKGLRIVIPDEIRLLSCLPSVISGSSRTKLDEKNQEYAVNNIKDFYAVVLVGGDDHARQAGQLARLLKESNIQVPVFIALKTVDNDTVARPIGADTAIEHQRKNFLSTAVTAWAHRKISIYENMGRDRGWLTIGAGDIRLSKRDKRYPERTWILKQTGPAVINLIPERPAYLADLLIEVVGRMSQEEALYDARLRLVGKTLRIYALLNVCEGYQLRDFAKGHRKKKDTLFYRLLELDRSLKAKFYAVKEYDIHGNPKLAGLSDYIVSAIKYVPELMKYDYRLKKAVDVLRSRMLRADVQENEVFGREKRLVVIAGVRQNIPNYIIRGPVQNIYDRVYGLNIGRFAITAIKKARKQIAEGRILTHTGFVMAVNKDSNPFIVKVRLMSIEKAARGVDVASVYADAQLRQMGVWWKNGR